MSTQKEVAESLRLRLLSGYASVADAIVWADTIVALEAAPHVAVIDVALAGNKSRSAVADLLLAVPGAADKTAVRRRFLASMLHDLNTDPSRGEAIARELYRLSRCGELPETDFGSEADYLDDAFDMVRCGIFGTYEQAVQELREYLERHSTV